MEYIEKIESEYELANYYRNDNSDFVGKGGLLWAIWLRGKSQLNRIIHAKAIVRVKAARLSESEKRKWRNVYRKLSELEKTEIAKRDLKMRYSGFKIVKV